MHDILNFPSHCGSKIFHNFFAGSTASYKYYFHKATSNTAFAIFINEPFQKKAYDRLKKRFKILYQSPILTPKASYQNPYFIVIYLNEKPGK